MPDFLIRAGLAGLAVALAAGPLGCFVVWRRMAYFGDATAHAAILGVALSLMLSLPLVAGVAVAALAMAYAVSSLSGRLFALDTTLGVAAHAALAVGIVAVALSSPRALDLEGYLFGEILAVTGGDLIVIWTGTAAVLLLLWWRWSPLLTATLNADLAQASGLDPRREQLVLVVTLAMLVAVAIKVVGALMITAMLIIPAAAARPLSATPERMAVFAAAIGAAAVGAGLALSWRLDSPTGPTIVASAAGLFALSIAAAAARARLRP